MCASSQIYGNLSVKNLKTLDSQRREEYWLSPAMFVEVATMRRLDVNVGMMNKMSEPILKLYAVRNSDGLYFRSRGWQGWREMWAEDLKLAKVYGKIGPARSRITFFARDYKDYPPPELVELRVTAAIVLDEKARLEKVAGKHAREKEARKVEEAKRILQSAYEDMAHAEKEIRKAKLTIRKYKR